jgi:hypothetical protein
VRGEERYPFGEAGVGAETVILRLVVRGGSNVPSFFSFSLSFCRESERGSANNTRSDLCHEEKKKK